MAHKPLTKPRKYARQERSRVMVDALIEATARILVQGGFEAASTNRIADLAGVSVGSLYQYFPSKEALTVAVIERHHQQTMQVVRDVLQEVAELPMEKAVHKLVAAAIDAHRVNPRLHRVLAEQLPRIGRLDTADAFSRETQTLFRNWLELRANEIRAVDLDLAAFVCVSAIEAVTHNAVLHRPRSIPEEKFDDLVEEATQLIVGYLR